MIVSSSRVLQHFRGEIVPTPFRTACAALLVALAAITWPAAADEDEAEPRAERADPDKRVCRTVKVTGSHMRQRVCFKQREWDAMREEAQRERHNAGPDYEGNPGPQ